MHNETTIIPTTILPKELYNVMIIRFKNGKVYVTARTDIRDEHQVYASRHDGKDGVWAELRLGDENSFTIDSPPRLQGIAKYLATEAKFDILAGEEAMHGPAMILNSKGIHLKAI